MSLFVLCGWMSLVLVVGCSKLSLVRLVEIGLRRGFGWCLGWCVGLLCWVGVYALCVSLVCSSVWWLVLTTVRILVCHDQDGRPKFGRNSQMIGRLKWSIGRFTSPTIFTLCFRVVMDRVHVSAPRRKDPDVTLSWKMSAILRHQAAHHGFRMRPDGSVIL